MPVKVPPVPIAGDDDVDHAAGVGPDLLGSGGTVHVGVGLVFELPDHDHVGILLIKSLRHIDGALRAKFLGR